MKLLIAVEDKIFGEAIAQFIMKIDWSDQIEMKLIHVIEPFHADVLSGYMTEQMSSLHEQRQHAGKILLLSLSTKLTRRFPDITVRQEVVDGHPKEVILNQAKDWPADLIVLGSHGRSGIGQFFLGSVSMSVLSAAPCSLVIVKLPHALANEQNENMEPAVQKT